LLENLDTKGILRYIKTIITANVTKNLYHFGLMVNKMANNLKDIAKKIGVSVSTISRVANGKNYVAPATKKLVMAALAEHNYVPNQVARSLKSQSTNSVGIIVPDISDYFVNVIKGADIIFSQNSYSIILADSNEDPQKEELYLKLLYEKRVDGLVLATVSKEHKALSLFLDNSIPVIFIDNLPNLNISYDCVLIDNAKASAMVVNHLVAGGHRRIAIISGLESQTTGRERLKGYKQALQHHDIEIDPELIKYGDFKKDSGYRCMMEFLENKQAHDFTALYVTSYKMTCGAIKAMKEKGISWPKDIALVGFDFTDDSELIAPEITTVLQPISSIGKLVAQVLITKMNKLDPIGEVAQRIMLDPVLKIAESCGCKKD
jgi:LacI family transcriptional regulator